MCVSVCARWGACLSNVWNREEASKSKKACGTCHDSWKWEIKKWKIEIVELIWKKERNMPDRLHFLWNTTLSWASAICTTSCIRFLSHLTPMSNHFHSFVFALFIRDDLLRKQTRNWWKSCSASNRLHLCMPIWPILSLVKSLSYFSFHSLRSIFLTIAVKLMNIFVQHCAAQRTSRQRTTTHCTKSHAAPSLECSSSWLQ